MISLKLFFLLFSLSVLFGCSLCADIQNKRVTRTVDLKTQLARHKLEITIENTGSEEVKEYSFYFPKDVSSSLSWFSVTDSSSTVLNTKHIEDNDKGSAYSIILSEPISSGSTGKIVVNYILTHLISAFPASISQSERQLVRYTDSHLFYSPYKTVEQKTSFKFPSSSIQSNTPKDPMKKKGDEIVYGTYKDQEAFSTSPCVLHYENNSPFLTIKSLERVFEISHFGNINLLDYYSVSHDGAELSGSFSRYEYQINPSANGQSAIKSMKTYLPGHARDVYYRDDIGNISTSHLSSRKYKGENAMLLELVPRFPLFGGWKTSFLIGYNLPTAEKPHLLFVDKSDSSLVMLNTTFGLQYGSRVVIDSYKLKFILPEGSSNIKFHAPFEIDGEEEGLHFTYLDVQGRPTLTIEKKNVVNEHLKVNFQVTYNFSKLSMLQEPLLLIGAFFVLFLTSIIYSRIDISITPISASEAKEDKLYPLLSRYSEVIQTREDISREKDAVLEKHLKSKGAGNYKTEKQQADKQFLACSKEAQTIISKVEEIDEGFASKLREIENKHRDKRSNQADIHKLKIQYKKDKKITKGTYEEQKQDLDNTLKRIDEQYDALVSEITEEL